MPEFLQNFPLAFWNVLSQMAPFLLFGFFIAGILSVFISPEWVERHLGSNDTTAVVKTALAGVPLPLCSCGVIPVASSLRYHGASKGAVTAFLISTPQTGADSVLATWSLLGPFFALFRPVIAFISGIIGGMIVNLTDEGMPHEPDNNEPDNQGTCNESCVTPTAFTGTWSRVTAALRYGFVTLPGDIAGALIFGLIISGIITVIVPDDFFAELLPAGIWQILVVIVTGIPLYICATSSIPVAAAMICKGLSPGAALAFLAVGPATNAATITTVWKTLGRRTLIIFLAVVALTAILSGLAVNHFFDLYALHIPDMHHHDHSSFYHANSLAALILLFLLANALYQLSRQGEPEYACDIRLRITGMTCSHCAASVSRVLSDIPGVKEVKVDLHTGIASVQGTQKDDNMLIKAIEAIGYSAVISDKRPENNADVTKGD